MKIAIASDHAALELKAAITKALRADGHEVDDLGPADASRVDYPDFARKVAAQVAGGHAQFGVLVCGSGIGMAISANKVRGIRAAVIHDAWEAEMSRRHNNANVACFGQRSMGEDRVIHALRVFVATGFEGGRHAERVAKIAGLEADNAR